MDSNGCVQKWNTTVTGESGTDKVVASLVDCSLACKEEDTCEVFLYEEEENNCTLFAGDAFVEEISGNGTVGYCLEGILEKFV